MLLQDHKAELVCDPWARFGAIIDAVREDTKAQLKARLQVNGIIVTEFNITNFNFSKVFNDAIEAKVTAEQQALAAKNKLEQIKFEAEQQIAEAKGKAEAMTVESNALRSVTADSGRTSPVRR